MIEILLDRNPQLFENNQDGINITNYLNNANLYLSNSPNYLILKEEILAFFNSENIDASKFNRIQLSNYWNTQNSFASKMLLTLWWGVMSIPYNAPRLYSNQNFNRFAILEQPIYNTQNDLYITFEKIDSGFDGVGYRYFTKFMQFMTQKSKQQAIIADQWSMKAAIAYLISMQDWDRLNRIFTPLTCKNDRIGNPDFRTRRRSKSASYMEFLTVFEEMRQQVNQRLGKEYDLFRIEEGFFGWGHDINNPQNPRNLYHEIIGEHLGCR